MPCLNGLGKAVGREFVCADIIVNFERNGTLHDVKGFPYSSPSVGPGADPGVQAVSLQVTISHPPVDRLPLLSARPVVTAAEHHRPLAGTHYTVPRRVEG